MPELEQVKRAVGFTRKLDEIKRKAFEEELLRLEKETEQQGSALAKMLQVKDDHLLQELRKDADQSRRREEELLKKREAEIRSRLTEELAKKKMRRAQEEHVRRDQEQEHLKREQKLREESLTRAEEDRRREEVRLRELLEEERHRTEAEHKRREAEAQQKAEEERLRQEELLRQQREEFQRREEERLRQETERKRIEDELLLKEAEEQRKREAAERLRKEAEEKLRQEEELRRQLEERKRQEEEQKRQQAEARLRLEQEKKAREAEERQARILELLSNAEAFYTNGNYDHALVEIAKALVNDPSNEAAKQLEAKIKTVQGEKEGQETDKTAPAHNRRSRKELKPKFEKREKHNKIPSRPIYIAATIVLTAVVVFSLIQLKKTMFPPTTTVAILPWTSASNTPEETIEGSSLAEEVTKQFGQHKQASVMGFSSAYGLAHYTNDPTQAIFRLGYSYILHGTLTKSELGISLNLRLVDSLGTVRWSEHYDKSIASLPSLPGEIAGHLADALDIPPARNNTAVPTTSAPDAYLLYLRGLELLHRHTQIATQNAFEVFHAAIDQDPAFGQALAAASLCLTTMVEEHWSTADTTLGVAQELAERGIRANASIDDGYIALGKVLMLNKDFSRALDEYNIALKHASNNSDVYLSKGTVYLSLGKYKEAIEALTHAYDLNPRDPDILRSLGFAYQLSGKMEQSVWYHQTALYFVEDSTDYLIGPLADAIILDPGLSLTQSARVISACEHRVVQNPEDFATAYRLGRMLQVTGNRIEGTALLEKLEKTLRTKSAVEPSNGSALIYLALTLTRLGKFPEATAWGQKALQLNANDPIIRYRLAQMYSLQMYSPQRKKIDEKKKEEAMKTLKAAIRLSYRLDELINADFYNMNEYCNFNDIIRTSNQ